jgi:NADH-quinone oxidoreductase subunit G
MAALLSPGSTVEEMYLVKKVMAGMGCGNVEHRLRQSDFTLDGNLQGASWLGMAIAELSQLKNILLVGSTVRKEQPLVALKLRQAVKQGAQLNVIHTADDNLLAKVANKSIVAPGALVNALAQVLKAAAETSQAQTSVNLDGVIVTDAARRMAESLASGKSAVLLGHVAQHHPRYGELHMLAAEVARITGATLGVLAEGANSVGGQLVKAVSGATVLAKPHRAYMLVNVEPEYDCANGTQVIAALQQADMVVALTSYKGQAMDYATVLLPVAAFAENSGTYVNMEGRVQGFAAAVKPQGEARPAWKVLRVLGNLLGLDGFDYEGSEEVRDEALAGEVTGKLSNRPAKITVGSVAPMANGLQRLGEVPLYATDAIVRRSPSLQKTADALAPRAFMPGSLLARLGVKEGDMVVVKQGSGVARLPATRCDKLPEDCVRVAAGYAETAALGSLLGEISVERA